jgi:cell division protein FtsB
MKRTRPAGPFEVLRRLAFGLLLLVVTTLVSIQFARIVHENIAMSRSLTSVEQDVRELRVRRREQAHEIRRLMDPQGAVPAIHEQLHLVRPDETIIYVKRPPALHV